MPTGEATTTVSPFVPGGVSDGQWHRVQLHYYNKVGAQGARGARGEVWGAEEEGLGDLGGDGGMEGAGFGGTGLERSREGVWGLEGGVPGDGRHQEEEEEAEG